MCGKAKENEKLKHYKSYLKLWDKHKFVNYIAAFKKRTKKYLKESQILKCVESIKVFPVRHFNKKVFKPTNQQVNWGAK